METTSTLFSSQMVCSFKSYYVVWKRRYPIPTAIKCMWFKSYYVVWKLLKPWKNHAATESLNRTMQYGNEEYPEYRISAVGSLNRTMQYGNKNGSPFIRKPEVRLNRTMQYGNSHGRRPSLLPCSGFKSYYVVWKPDIISLITTRRLCLNRTMQYGNEEHPEYRISAVGRLNRTMQYGNNTRNISLL